MHHFSGCKITSFFNTHNKNVKNIFQHSFLMCVIENFTTFAKNFRIQTIKINYHGIQP